MKKLIALCGILFLISCSDAPEIKKEPANRIVLAEFFTFARCVYCPYAEEALDSLSKEFKDSLAIIAHHRRVLGDTLSPFYVAVRESLYSIQTSPVVVFDGLYNVQTEKPEDDYPTYKNYITTERGKKTGLRLNLEKEIEGSMVSLQVKVVAVDSIVSSDYRLFIVLSEDSVYFKQTGAPDSIFYFVMRKMIPDEKGIKINPAFPDSIIEEMNFVLQPTWNADRLNIVAFVQDMLTKEVIQAVAARLKD